MTKKGDGKKSAEIYDDCNLLILLI